MTRIEVNIPEGTSGNFEIAHYTSETTDNRWSAYLQMKNESYNSHTVLLKVGCNMPIMQDSEAEYNEHQWLWNNAEGHVLIGGLGIGMCHQPLIDNPNVTAVTIVENSQDVIDLVWQHCAKDETFTLVHNDFETWNPSQGTTFNTVFADTWLTDNPLKQNEYKTIIIDRYSPYIDTPGAAASRIGFWGGL